MPSILTRKRKTSKENSMEDTNDDFVPIPIQFFFWNQTSLFIKKKFGKLTEAHAMNFEKVLVQNILHGLSPGLSNAINSISRWAFIKASFPHIIHACAATLTYRRDNLPPDARLDKTEIKLLYTLHWLILDAACECEDNFAYKKKKKSSLLEQKCPEINSRTANNTYLHSVSTIQLFVYLFVPILPSLKPEDFDNLKLSNGLKIWEPLWAYRQPAIQIFDTPVKQKQTNCGINFIQTIKSETQNKTTTTQQVLPNNSSKLGVPSSSSTRLIVSRNSSIASSFGEIYMGESCRNSVTNETSPRHSLNASIGISIEQHHDEESTDNTNRVEKIPGSKSSGCLLASDVTDLDEKENRLSLSTDNQISDTSFKTFTGCNRNVNLSRSDDMNMGSMESSTIQSNQSQEIINSKFNQLKAPIVLMSSICSVSSESPSKLDVKQEVRRKFSNISIGVFGSDEKRPDVVQTAPDNPHNDSGSKSDTIRYATFFDVAIMRCLLSSKWHSEGYIWALEYLGHRVSEITDYVLKEQDIYLKFNKSISVPTRLNELCILMGHGATDPYSPEGDQENMFIYDTKTDGLNNQFIELVNQIYNENDFTNPKYTLGNYFDHSKRKKYQANYHNRIRRIRYIDDDLQPRRLFPSKPVLTETSSKEANNNVENRTVSSPNKPFTLNKLQHLNLEDQAFRTRLKKDLIMPRNASKMRAFEWPQFLDDKLNRAIHNLSSSRGNSIIGNRQETPERQPLNRLISFSDTRINYQASYRDIEEASGSSGLINLDGSLNLNMVLKGLHSVILKENSLKLCELTLYILENLLNIDIMPSEEIDNKLDLAKKDSSLSPSSHVFLENLEVKYNENFFLATDVALRNIKLLGCFNCQMNSKTFLNEQLRGKIKLLLGRLHSKNARRFKAFFKIFIKENDINHITDTFHALLGYCHDPYFGFGHYHPYISIKNMSTRAGDKPSSIYANNFGATDKNKTQTQEATVNIESVMVDLLLKPIVNRLIDMKEEIMNQENLYLFSDLRSLFGYIKENHGGVFRKVLFSNMLEPLIKLKHENQERDIKLKVIDEQLEELELLLKKANEQCSEGIRDDSPVRNFQAQRSPFNRAMTTTSESVINQVNGTETRTSSRASLITQDHEASPVGSPVKQTDQKNEKNSPHSSGLWPLRIANLRKNNKRQFSHVENEKFLKQQSQDSDTDKQVKKPVDLHSVSSSSNFLTVINKDFTLNDSQTNFFNINNNDTMSNGSRRSSGTSLRTLVNLKKFNIKDLINKEMAESKLEASKADLNDLEVIQHALEFANQQRKKLQNERRFVDVNLVYKGIEHYRFLSECLPPASVPDVPFMSALLELEAPLISKAAFLLETAYFVNRCNRKDWPDWIKMNIAAYLPQASALGSPKNMPNPMRRNKIFQLAASNMFLAWAEVLGNKLEKILDEQETSKRKYNKVDLTPEDYYDEGMVNPNGNDCPFALQNIVCILLLEITSFLRETYQYMPKKLSNTSDVPGSMLKDCLTKMNSGLSGIYNDSQSGVAHDIENEMLHSVREKRMSRVENLNRRQSNDNVSLNPAEQRKNTRNSPENEAVKRISFKLNSNSGVTDQPVQEPVESQSATSLRSSNTNASQKRHNGLKSLKRASLKIRELSRLRSPKPEDPESNHISLAFDSENHQNNSNIVSFANEMASSGSLGGTLPTWATDFCEVDEIDYNRTFPWIKVVVKLLGSLKFECDHQKISRQKRRAQEIYESQLTGFDATGGCSIDCYLKQFKSGHCLIEAVLRMYETSNNLKIVEKFEREQSAKETRKKNSSLKTVNKKSSFTELKHKEKKETSGSNRIKYLNSLLQNSQAGQSSCNVQQLTAIAVITQQIKHEQKLPTKKELNLPTISFIQNHIQSLNQIPLLVLCKGILIMQDEHFSQLIPIVWQLLLNSDQDIASSAATLFIISAIKQPQLVEGLLRRELKSSDSSTRYSALLKFESLWKFRYHVWPRLESNANNILKISPPCIEFVLPSPPIGIPILQPVDPAWMIKVKAKVTEVTANQEETKRAVVTASKSRKKHHQEVVYKAFQADIIARKLAREQFRFTNLGYLNHAAYEPFMHQTKEEPEEGAEDILESSSSGSDIQQSQPVFPAAISTGVVYLIDLLNQPGLNSQNQSVSVLANRIIYNCLIDDTALFLRYFFEKITQKDRKNTLIQYLRVLLSSFVDLPQQTAYTLFNYLLGVVMHFVRISAEGSQEAVSSILSLIWQIVSHVNGIVFKDLKQLLKKEQCEPSLLITSNIPSAKKLIVHGPDLSQIPTQSAITEDTQFLNILQESFEFFGIPESKRDKHFLFDVKTNQIHVPDTYVRNFYFFCRNFSPQLSLVQMEHKDAVKLLERAAFNLKVLEESKVLFFRKLLTSAVNKVHSSAAFLHEELVKLPMFPRKPLEADFNLYPKLSDRELLTTDMLHKYSWCQLIWSLFSSMDSKTASTWDLTSFLNIINGSFILHADDFNMIRTCLAIYINSAKHFQHVFATNGFLIILPTLVKVYSNNQANPLVKSAIEFTCLQFYVIHRIPFILQLFGSVAQILDKNKTNLNVVDTNKIQSSCLMNILLSMETNKSVDSLKIMDLVRGHTSIQLTSSSLEYNSNSNSASDLKNGISPGNVATDGEYTRNNTLTGADLSIPGSLVSGLQVNTGVVSNGQNPPNLANFMANNNLLMPGLTAGSKALDFNQINMLKQGAGIGNMNSLNQSIDQTPEIRGPIASAPRTHDDYKQLMNNLELNYSDETRFSVIDTVNTCVTVVAYASHTSRSNQMLIILDAILPLYLKHLKSETDSIIDQFKGTKFNGGRTGRNPDVTRSARLELTTIQKLACALKTLVNTSDFLTRFYSGPKSNETKDSMKENKNKSMVSSIQPDDDSIRFSEDKPSTVNKPSRVGQQIDEKQLKKEFRSPRDYILNILSEFMHFAVARIKNLYKLVNDPGLKITELLDMKTQNKLVEIANALLKLWDDSSTLNGNGLQSYFQKLMPVTNWSDDNIKPAFSNLLRRVERLFTKISKRSYFKRQLDWTAVAGLLSGLHLALDRDENLARILYFKLVVNSAIALVINELNTETYTNPTALNSSSLFVSQPTGSTANRESNFQVPEVYSKVLIKLVGKYINSQKDQANLEQFYCSIIGTNQINAPLSMPSGVSYLVNFLMPLLFHSASGSKDAPKLNNIDLSFVVSMLLNALKPPSKLAATLLLQAPKQHHLTAFDASTGLHNKTSKHLKDTISQATFLAFKFVTYAFNKDIDLARIALTIRQMFSKPKTIYFWRFLDFTCAHKTSLFLLIKPFVEGFVASHDCENEREQVARLSILNSLNCTASTNVKSKNAVIGELIQELTTIQNDIQDSWKNNYKLQNVSPTDPHTKPGSFKRHLSVHLKKRVVAKLETDRIKLLSRGASCDEDSLPFPKESSHKLINLLKQPINSKKKRTASLDMDFIPESPRTRSIEKAISINTTVGRKWTNKEKLRMISSELVEDNVEEEDASNEPKSTNSLEPAVKDQTSDITPQVTNQRSFDLRTKKLTKSSAAEKNGSQSPAPRKKLEKLSCKSAANILDIYKSKNSKMFMNKKLMNDVSGPKEQETGRLTSKIGKVNVTPETPAVLNEINKQILEAEKENEETSVTDDKAILIPDRVKPVMEMKISKKKKIVFV